MIIIHSFILSLFDLICYILITMKLTENKRIDYKKAIGYVVVVGITVVVLEYLGCEKYIVFSAGALLNCIAIKIIYNKHIQNTIYIYMISTVIIMCVQLAVVFILHAFNIQVLNQFLNGIVVQTISIILILLIIQFLPINLIYNFVESRNKTFKYLLINLFIIVVILLMYWYINIEGILGNTLWISSILVIIGFINLVFLRSGLVNEYEGKQLKLYENYIPIIDELMDEIKSKQHEYDNHIQALKMVFCTNATEKEQIELIKGFLGEIEKKNDFGNLVKLNNKILAGFLYSKRKKAELLGIRFNIEIENNYFSTYLKDYEFIELFGNIIDNAFEASKKDDKVLLKIRTNDRKNIIYLKNQHSRLSQDKIEEMFSKGYSTKRGDKRGYGLDTVKNIIKKNNGDITVYNEKFEDVNYVVFRLEFV